MVLGNLNACRVTRIFGDFIYTYTRNHFYMNNTDILLSPKIAMRISQKLISPPIAFVYYPGDLLCCLTTDPEKRLNKW